MIELFPAWTRVLTGAVLLAASLALSIKAWQGNGALLPQVGRTAHWLRGFRWAALAAGCLAVASGILAGQLWLIAVGLAFGFEETMETSACITALTAPPESSGPAMPKCR